MEKIDMNEMKQKELLKAVSQTNTQAQADKANDLVVKPLTKLVALGEEGAACHFVDGKVICD